MSQVDANLVINEMAAQIAEAAKTIALLRAQYATEIAELRTELESLKEAAKKDEDP